MPFYEYQCTACAHRLEALQKIVDAPLLYCPECGEPSLKKLISKSAFRLKGAGWYATDFKNSGAPADKDKERKKDADGKKDKDGEGKPDAGKPGGKDGGGGKSSSPAEPLQKSA